jgi:hypothetical protein
MQYPPCPAATEQPKSLVFDTLVWEHWKPEHLVPADQAVVPRMEQDRLRYLTLGGMSLVSRADIFEHFDL